jgi:hypothetical protein
MAGKKKGRKGREGEGKKSQTRWYMAAIPTFRRLRQEDQEFQACLEVLSKYKQKVQSRVVRFSPKQ